MGKDDRGADFGAVFERGNRLDKKKAYRYQYTPCFTKISRQAGCKSFTRAVGSISMIKGKQEKKGGVRKLDKSERNAVSWRGSLTSLSLRRSPS